MIVVAVVTGGYRLLPRSHHFFLEDQSPGSFEELREETEDLSNIKHRRPKAIRSGRES